MFCYKITDPAEEEIEKQGTPQGEQFEQIRAKGVASVYILGHETPPLLSLLVGFKNVELVIHSSQPLKKIPLR